MATIIFSDTNLLALWLLFVLLAFGVSSLDAVRQLVPDRLLQLSELARTRLYRMMVRRNVGIARYLKQTGAGQRSEHMKDCNTCSSKSRCDAAIASAENGDFSFCPRNAYLEKLARMP